jgi:hypothetical protein
MSLRAVQMIPFGVGSGVDVLRTATLVSMDTRGKMNTTMLTFSVFKVQALFDNVVKLNWKGLRVSNYDLPPGDHIGSGERI